MNLSRRHFLLSLPIAAAAVAAEGDSPPVSIRAGPFQLQCPAKWAQGAKAEKVASLPVYSRKAWNAYQKDPSLANKPSYDNRPEHWAIRLPKLASSEEGSARPEILIHRAAGWASVMQDGREDKAAGAKLIAELRAGLERMEKEKSAFSSPAYMDAHFTFLSLKKALSFKKGRGIRLIGHWTIEPSLLSRENLHYMFLGMSDDDTCHIIATFPLRLKGLPSGYDAKASHLGFSIANYRDLAARFDDYEKKVVALLEGKEAELQPRLADLDAMIESLEVETWK